MAYSRFDYTQWGTGLDSQGLPRDMNKVYDFYKQVAANPSTAYNKGILSGIQGYAKNNPGSTSDPFWVTNALDWYWRDIQRKSQKENGIFDVGIGKIIGDIAPYAAAFLPAGQFIAPALGATIGGVRDGLGGAVMGGVKGYFAGKAAPGISNAFSNAGGLSTLVKSPLTFASNVGRGALTSAQNFIPGYGGNVAGQLAGRVAGTATGLAGNVGSIISGGSSVANGAATGGSNMGWFTDILKQAAPNILGGAVNTGINYLASTSAQNQMDKAAQQAQQASQFNPYNVSTPAGSASFNGTTATGTLSPAMQKMLAQFEGIQGGALSDYNKFNTGNFSQNYYDTIKRYKMPYDQAQTNQLLERVYNTGNWESTTGARDVYSYEQAKRLEDDMLRIQAQQAGAQEQDRLFDRYFKASAAAEGLRNSPNELITMGGNLGGTAGSINASAAQYPWLAAGSAANASTAFWSTIADAAGAGATSILNAYGASKNANRPVTYAPSPNFSGGNSTMTWRD